MKKLIILVSLIALLASGMAFGQITWTGTLEWEVASDFDSETPTTPVTGIPTPGGLELWEPDHYLHLNAKADDFNSAYVRVRYNGASPTQNVYVDKAVLTTNFLGAMGVKNAPLTWKSELGLNEWVPANVGNAGWDITKKVLFRVTNTNDYFFDEKISGTRQTMVLADGMVTVAGFFGLENARLQDLFVDAVVAPIPGLKAEVAYMKWENATANVITAPGTELGEGTVMIAAEYSTRVQNIGIMAGAAYYHPMDTEFAYAVYAANVKATVGDFYLLAGLQGYPDNDDLGIESEILSNVRVAAGLKLTPKFGFDAGMLLYMGDADMEALNTLDLSAYMNAGKAVYRVGYIMVPEDEYSIDPYMTDSRFNSFYLKATLNF